MEYFLQEEMGLARRTVHKMPEYSLPPGYQRQKPVRRPKLGPWQGAIDAILEDGKQRPRRQRRPAKLTVSDASRRRPPPCTRP